MSLASFVLTTIPLVACTLDGGTDYGSCSYGNCYEPPSYNNPPDYGYDAAPACTQGFTTSFVVSDSSGACEVQLSSDAYTYETVSYFFAAPKGGEAVQCATFGSPILGTCARVDGVITLGTTTEAQLTAIRSLLGTSSALKANIACEHALVSGSTKNVPITCSEHGDDAGAATTPDASVSLDAAADTAAEGGDAGCGP